MISASVDELRSAIGVLELPPPPSVVSFEKKNEKWGQTNSEVVFFVNVLGRYFHFGVWSHPQKNVRNQCPSTFLPKVKR